MSKPSWDSIDMFAERLCDDRCGVPVENDECGVGRGEWHLLTEREKDQWRATAEMLVDVMQDTDESHEETVSDLSEARDSLEAVADRVKDLRDAHDKMLDFVNGLVPRKLVGSKKPKPVDLKAFVDEMRQQLNAVHEVITALEDT